MRPLALAANGVAALDHADQHNDDRNDEKDVDQAPKRVGRSNPKQPERDEDEDECGHQSGLPFQCHRS